MSVMDHVCEKLGRNTGMKAIFGGSVKKPLTTKVSMRHLNEIVRERNQYSRDAMEAWQDFINLKGRMDTEISKVTKRNNFLVEELETWKQQFLKFQAFAEQLTKETSELKVKIETHKRENRRLSGLIDQQKDDLARLTVRLSGTEKQRDDALEALVLQQEIAEELERERKRNQKELSGLQHTNASLLHQRDEAQRVVLHLRTLIGGQSTQMDHIARSIGNSTELADLIEQPAAEDSKDAPAEVPQQQPEPASSKLSSSGTSTRSKKKSMSGRAMMKDMNPELEQHLLNMSDGQQRLSRLNITDVADRYLRDKTDAISEIVRSISDQCAAAVEGLHLAQDAVDDDVDETGNKLAPEADGRSTREGSEVGDSLHPDGRGSSLPPTPDLVHNRSSTSMSMVSNSTYPERSSQQYGPGEIPTQIVEDDDERAHETHNLDDQNEPGNLSKQASEELIRPGGSHLVS